MKPSMDLPKKPSADPSDPIVVPSSGLRVTVSWRLAGALAALALAPWLVVALVVLRPPGDAQQGEGGNPAPAAPALLPGGWPAKGQPGPWGELEYVPISITPPTEFMAEMEMSGDVRPWWFPGMTADQVRAYFERLELTPEQKSRLLAGLSPAPQVNGFVITPDPEVVKTLSPEARRRLYRRLSAYNQNVPQVNAFRITPSEYEQRLMKAAIPEAARQLVRQLTYHEDRYDFFADLPLVLPLVAEEESRVQLLKMLARQTSALVRLRVRQDTAVGPLAEYWGRGGRTKELRPLLESLANVSGGQAIDIVHLLPGFARRRIYTYPRPSNVPLAANQDCHWTSLNFFNDLPDDRFLNTQTVTDVIERDYYPVYGSRLLGDIVLVAVNGGSIIHSAVYIANDIVFTKNGSRWSAPWMFMRLDDVKGFYPRDGAISIQFIRRNDL
ncbi:MAG: hypothetical protein IMZ44_15170 [Planctomycetes bacterium]|nr:hypothetical protein [Planctomycetota bacterium]